MTLTERCAYIKGLAEGLNLNADKAEAKLINALIELCSEMAEEIECLGEDVEDLIDYCEELDEDLGDVEEVLIEEFDDEDYDDEDEDEEWDDEDEDFECCGDCSSCFEDCEFADEEYYEIVCPSCGETVCFDESVNAEELICPACGEKLGCIVEDDDKQ